jgi:hypothetical protein
MRAQLVVNVISGSGRKKSFPTAGLRLVSRESQQAILFYLDKEFELKEHKRQLTERIASEFNPNSKMYE